MVEKVPPRVRSNGAEWIPRDNDHRPAEEDTRHDKGRPAPPFTTFPRLRGDQRRLRRNDNPPRAPASSSPEAGSGTAGSVPSS